MPTPQAGASIGPYRLLERIGEGGMGEVYKAQDTRLGRSVAIKFSKENFSERFDREARAIARLNHPRICSLFDVGPSYLVMEYVEGAPLKGPLPLEKVVSYGGQICEALHEAHGKGIVHRDLKPSNILVTAQGVKILDFGLAKLTHPVTGQGDATLSASLTETGVVLGTPGYMAPEQVRGEEASPRSDIFALGAILYELATGKRAFRGSSAPETLAAVLHSEPAPITDSPGLDRLIARCLRKEPGERFQDAFDVKLVLDLVSRPPETAPQQKPASRIGTVAFAVAGIAALAVAAWLYVRRTQQQPSTAAGLRAVIPLDADETIPSSTGPLLAFSPDGRILAFVARNRANQDRIFLRLLDSFSARAVAGTEGGSGPFFSPDGQWLGFFAAGKLKKVRLGSGSPAVTICDAPASRGASWGPNDVIVFSGSAAFGGGLSRVDAGGGVPKPITRPDIKKSETSHRWPQFLPGGGSVVYTAWSLSGFAGSRISILDLASGQSKVLINGGSYARIAGSQIVYARADGLAAFAFDANRMTAADAPSLLDLQALGAGGSGASQFDISPTGTLAFIAGTTGSLSRLVRVNLDGSEQVLLEDPAFHQAPSISPDGRHVMVARLVDGNFDIWKLEIGRRSLTRMTLSSDRETVPRWMPDGQRIVFSSDRHGAPNIFMQSADGSGEATRLTNAETPEFVTSVSRDGSLMAVDQHGPDGNQGIGLQPLNPVGPARPFLTTEFIEADAVFSPDGKYLAYASNESGQFEVYVQPVTGGAKYKVSAGGGEQPAWPAAGHDLFYVNGNQGKMMAASIQAGANPTFGAPRALFPVYTGLTRMNSSFDVSSDGRWFVFAKPVLDSGSASSQLQLVTGALAGLQSRR